MSESTKAALDAAIAAHVADECEPGAMVTGYVLKAAYTSIERVDDESTGYYMEYAEHQPYHVSLGLGAPAPAGPQGLRRVAPTDTSPTHGAPRVKYTYQADESRGR